jgi:hypothetical protein
VSRSSMKRMAPPRRGLMNVLWKGRWTHCTVCLLGTFDNYFDFRIDFFKVGSFKSLSYKSDQQS